MNKDLHDIDELFRSSLEGHEEMPSVATKENLDAALDKLEAKKYKKRFILWKRTTFILLLLLAGFVLYESEIIKTNRSSPNLVDNDNMSSGVKESNKENTNSNTTNNSTNTEKESNHLLDNDEPANRNNQTVDLPLQQTSVDLLSNSNQKEKKNIFIKSETGNNWNLLNDKDKSLTSDKTGKTNFDRPSGKNVWTKQETVNTLPAFDNNSVAKKAGYPAIADYKNQLKPISDSLLKNKTANIKKVKRFQPFWMITPFASYDRIGYRLDSEEPDAITSIKHREAHEPSYTAGFLLTRQFSPRWGLQSGLGYSKSAIGMKPQKTYAFRDPTGDVAYKYITSSGYAFFKPGFGPQPSVGDSLTTAEAKHTIENFSVPLMAKFTAVNKKITVTAGAGIEGNIITKANLEVDIEDAFNREIVVVNKLSGRKSFYLSFIADAEIKYNINNKTAITLRPVYRNAISPITKNNVVETFPHSFGIGAGITLKF